LGDKNTTKHPDEKALSSLENEISKPRLAASVQKAVGQSAMTPDAKFRKGELLHNHNANEDGLVKRVYQFGDVFMYEVAVPVMPDSWANSFYISDWAESTLELSSNAHLKSSGKPPRDWP
jgi:hypothetical protein